MNHVLCYVQRRRISDWKRQVFREEEPLFMYGSNDRRVIPHMQAGDQLWIIAGHADGPPSLVARIVVDWVTPTVDAVLSIPAARLNAFRMWKWIVRGTDKSEFFGHNDASGALLNTVFCSPSGSPRVLSASGGPWTNALGGKLQAPTLIFPVGKTFGKSVSPGSALLEALAARTALSVFISYKWKDQAKAMVKELAFALERAGLMPWLDRLALPQSRVSIKISQDEEVLNRLLRYGYRQCVVLLGLYSRHYGQKTKASAANWTGKEWQGALDSCCDKIKVLYNPDGLVQSSVVGDRNSELIQSDLNKMALELKRIILEHVSS